VLLCTQSEKEEIGPGAGQQSEPELGAKDDTGDEPKRSAENKAEPQQLPDVESSEPQQCVDEVGAFFSVFSVSVDDACYFSLLSEF